MSSLLYRVCVWGGALPSHYGGLLCVKQVKDRLEYRGGESLKNIPSGDIPSRA